MTDDVDWTGRQSLLIGPVQEASTNALTIGHGGVAQGTLVNAPLATQGLQVWWVQLDHVLGANYHGDSAVTWVLNQKNVTTRTYLRGAIRPSKLSDHQEYASGVPTILGAELDYILAPAGFCDVQVILTIGYSVVG